MVPNILRAGFIEDTKKYAFSFVSVGYFDHVDHHGIERTGALLLPLAQYEKIYFNNRLVFNHSGVAEVYLDMPVSVSPRFQFVPFVFRNTEHDATGFGVSATVKLR